jgi:hypothetical protein
MRRIAEGGGGRKETGKAVPLLPVSGETGGETAEGDTDPERQRRGSAGEGRCPGPDAGDLHTDHRSLFVLRERVPRTAAEEIKIGGL